MEIQDKYSRQTYSYLALRKAVGWIGILLPFVLIFGAAVIFGETFIQKSISHYYHTDMRNLFVGALCAVGLFMLFYTGFDWRDEWLGTLAGIFVIGVAWFPTTETGPSTWVGKMHFAFAAAFFITLIIFSLFLFTRKAEKPTAQKLRRNKVYIVCGLIMSICLIVIAIYKFFIQDAASESSFVFWAETIALWAFGFSWLTKGEAIFPER